MLQFRLLVHILVTPELSLCVQVMAHKYKCIEEFLADAHNILHNMVLIYGGLYLIVLF